MATPPGFFKPLVRHCQYCRKNETPSGSRLLTCAGCLLWHYCSKECQRKDWPNHKVACKMNRETKERVKAVDAANLQNPGNLNTIIEKKLHKWIQVHRLNLMMALIQALQLQLHPERIDTHILHVTIAPTFTSKPLSTDVAKLFRLQSTMVNTFSETFEFLDADPLLSPGVPSIRHQKALLEAHSKKLRANGGQGAGAIFVVCPPIRYFSPIGIADVDLWSIKIDNEWENTLKTAFQKGI